MASGRAGVLVFDPSVAAASGETPKVPGGRGPTPDLSGGGNIAGVGTFYSKATCTAEGGWSDVSDHFSFTGTLAGTLTPEFSNSTDDEIRKGTDKWNSYVNESFPDPVVTIPAISGVQSFGVALARYPYGRVRYKLVVSGGSGTAKSNRVIKAS